MTNSRPTLQSAAWAMTGFLDAAIDRLRNDHSSAELRMYFYAVTQPGWRELSAAIGVWIAYQPARSVTAYVGTDHALTDRAALEAMRTQGLSVRLLRRYNGVYHPKMMWFVEGGAGYLLAGSNNLTFDGLKSNIEFATLTRLQHADPNLQAWHDAVHRASDPLADDLLDSYSREKEAFGKARAKAKVAGTFTWTKRSSGGTPPAVPTPPPIPVAASAAPVVPAVIPVVVPTLGPATPTAVILEIMPLETGTGGSQIQIPMRAARQFFGLGSGPRARIKVALTNVATGDSRTLTMTRFRNATARLVIRELDYRDRPCVVLFRRTAAGAFAFEIVRESIDPDRYRALYRHCGPPTRKGSRRWTYT